MRTNIATTTTESRWDLNQALLWIRERQPEVMRAGWCILLGGGVLNTGEGYDLDILLYPRTLFSKVEDVLAVFPPPVRVHDLVFAKVYEFNYAGRKVDAIIQNVPLEQLRAAQVMADNFDRH